MKVDEKTGCWRKTNKLFESLSSLARTQIGAELKPDQMQGEGPEAREAKQGERPNGDEQRDQGPGP